MHVAGGGERTLHRGRVMENNPTGDTCPLSITHLWPGSNQKNWGRRNKTKPQTTLLYSGRGKPPPSSAACQPGSKGNHCTAKELPARNPLSEYLHV